MKAAAIFSLLGAAVIALNAPQGLAQDGPSPVTEIADCNQAQLDVESADGAVLQSVESELQGGGGYALLKRRLPEMERALNHAPASLPRVQLCGNTLYFQSQGGSAALGDMLIGAALMKDSDKFDAMLHGRPRPANSIAVRNPYIRLSFYVGGTYNELHQYDRALVALNRGLALDPLEAIIVNEAAQALLFSHRAEEALVLVERALASGRNYQDRQHALLLRTRGFALGELRRYAEAEQAYRDSLVYDPGNGGALNEIRYYQGLQRGGQPTTVEMSTSDKFRKTKPPADDPPQQNPKL